MGSIIAPHFTHIQGTAASGSFRNLVKVYKKPWSDIQHGSQEQAWPQPAGFQDFFSFYLKLYIYTYTHTRTHNILMYLCYKSNRKLHKRQPSEKYIKLRVRISHNPQTSPLPIVLSSFPGADPLPSVEGVAFQVFQIPCPTRRHFCCWCFPL